MEVLSTVELEVAPARVLAEVADLATYPAWLGVVQRVEADGDGWLVDVGGRLGPVRRSKRVRMVRDEAPAGSVAFTRRERDGRADHGRWDLVAAVAPAMGEGPCRLEVRLRYEGRSPLVALLEPLLRAEAAKAGDRLRRRLTEPSPPA